MLVRPLEGTFDSIDPDLGLHGPTGEVGIKSLPSSQQVAVLGLVSVNAFAHILAAVPCEWRAASIASEGDRAPIVRTSQCPMEPTPHSLVQNVPVRRVSEHGELSTHDELLHMLALRHRGVGQ
jgi:hypothetical protein